MIVLRISSEYYNFSTLSTSSHVPSPNSMAFWLLLYTYILDTHILFKCFSSEGKVSQQLRAKDYHKATPNNKPHTHLFGGENPKCFCSVKKEQRTEQKKGFVKHFLKGRAFQGEDFWDSRLGLAVRAVRMFCEQNLVAGGPQGRGLATHGCISL